MSLIAGALCGLAAVAFHLSIIATEQRVVELAIHARGRTWILWTILIPTVGGLACGALLQYVVPGARGSGIPQVKVAYYLIGAEDVLEIRLPDAPLNTPTLFTVSASGLLDYPVLPEPIKVLGPTPREVGQRLPDELKRRAPSDKNVLVAVSDYNSDFSIEVDTGEQSKASESL